ncbi:Ig-like domain-containing protein [candidate division KSB1 bacterium]|nr:Ig-like domain-containing protein [candidate division KSB1 bacterium]
MVKTLVLGLMMIGATWSQVKIMPLGDSITSGKSGSSVVGGYRDDLAGLLDLEGVQYDLVGSLTDGEGFDADHEGHDSETSAFINTHINEYLTTSQPDIVLLHIGTNDIGSQIAIETIRTNINATITKIHNHNAQTAIVISSLMPRKDQFDETTTNLNALILESYYHFLLSGYKIYYAPINEIFKNTPNWQTQLMPVANNIHPNDAGYQAMAQVFYVAIMNQINTTGSVLTDNFNRLELGPVWKANPEFQIVGNELTNTTTVDGWNYLAIYAAQPNPTEVSMRWGASATATGIGEGGFALMLDQLATNANGYLLLIRTNGNLNLWTIRNGVPYDELATTPGRLPQPKAGDVVRVVITKNATGHHFQCYINNQETGIVSDPAKNYGNAAKLYAGVMLRGTFKNNVDDFSLYLEGDSTPPAAISDLNVISQGSSSVMLQWTTPGDDAQTGQASAYEIRYSKANITETNFAAATLARNLPAPGTPGTKQTFVVGGLDAGTAYFFAVKTLDEIPNISTLSNVASGSTISVIQTVDNFNRSQLGANWVADPQLQLVSGQLANVGGANQWDYVGVFQAKKNPVEAWLQWAASTTPDGIARGALLFLNNNAANASGYMVWVRQSEKYLSLWTVVNGMPQEMVINQPWATGPYTAAGDTFRVAISRDQTGHHFDLFKNGIFLSRLTDSQKRQLTGSTYYAGIMLHGGKDNRVENFGVATQLGTPSVLEYISGNNQTGRVNQPVTDSLRVRVADKDGNSLSGVNVDYQLTTGNGTLNFTANPDQNIRIQAEQGLLTAPMQVMTNDATASGGKYIVAPSGDAGDGRALYRIYIKEAGNYIVWGRVHAPSSNNNSFFIIMDGGEKLTWDLDFRQSTWHWDRVSNRGTGSETHPQKDPVIFNLSTGFHSLVVEEREYNTRIDAILLTKNANFTPSGKEEFQQYLTDSRGIAPALFTFGATAGQSTVEAAVPGLTNSPIRFTFTSQAAAPSELVVVTGDLQSGTGGKALANPLVVKVTDSFSNPIANIPVKFQALQGGGVITETQPMLTDPAGQAAAHYILGTEAAVNKVQVTSDSLPTKQVIFTATVTGGLAQQLVEVSGNHQQAIVKHQLPKPLVVKVLTDTQQPVSNHLVGFKVTKGSGTFDGNALKEISIRTDASGSASTTFFVGQKLDTCWVTATANGASGALVGSPITFTALSQVDAPKSLVLVSGQNQSGAAGYPLHQSLVVKVTDQYANPISGHAVTFTVTEGGGSIGNVNFKTTYTEADGTTQVYLTLGPKSQTVNRIQASAAHQGIALTGSPVIFSATAGQVAKIELVDGNSQSGSAGYPLAKSFKVRILDNSGGPVPQYPVDFSVTKGAASFSGAVDTLVTTDFEGTAQLTLTLGLTPGGSFEAEARAFLNGVALTGSPIKFNATAAILKELQYVSGNRQTGAAAQPLPELLKVKIVDAAKNAIAGQTVHFEVMAGAGHLGNGVRQVDRLTDSVGTAAIELTLGAAPGDTNNEVYASAQFNSQPLTGSPVRFLASTRVGAAAKLQVLQNYLVGVVGNALAEPFQVKIVDIGGNAIAGHPVTFKVTTGSGHFGSDSVQTNNTDSLGKAQVTLILGPATGDTNNVVLATAQKEGRHLDGSPVYLKASARASAAQHLVLLQGDKQTGVAGRPLPEPLVVKITDRNGNGVAAHPVTFKVKSGRGFLNGAADTLKVVNTGQDGLAKVTFTLSPSVQDTNAVVATSTNGEVAVTGSPVTFTAFGQAGPATATRSTLTCVPTELPADGETECQVTVFLADDYGNAVPQRKMKIVVSGAENVISPDEVFTDPAGLAKFRVKSQRAGLKTVNARNLTDNFDLTQTVTVRFKALTATKIELQAGNTQTANIGTALAQPLQVRITDRFTNPVPDFKVSFDVTSGGGAIFEPQPVKSDSNGIAAAFLIVGSTPGAANVVEARALGLTNSPVTFMATNANGKATQLEMASGNNQTAMSGSILPQALMVRVIDEKNLVIWNHPITFEVELGGGSLDDRTSKVVRTNEFGQAAVQFKLGEALGMNIIRVSADGLNGSPLKFIANGTAGKPAVLKLLKGDRQTAAIGGTLPEPLQVQVTDLNGNGVAGYPVTLAVVQGQATLLEPQPQVTNPQGIVASNLRVGTRAEAIVVEAVGENLVNSPVRFHLAVTPLNAALMQIAAGNNQAGTIGRELVFPFRVLIADDHQNPVPNVGVTFAVIEGSGQLLDGQVSYSDSNGIVAARFQLGNTPGMNKVFAIKSGLKNSPLTFTATGVTNKFPLFKNINDTTIRETQTLKFIVQASDEDGETVTYQALNLPSGATFDSARTQQFEWTPGYQQAGRHQIQFLASDPQGGFDAVDVAIRVLNVNRAPKIVIRVPQGQTITAPKNDTLSFQIRAEDLDQDALQYRWYQTFNNRTLLVSTQSGFRFISNEYPAGTYRIHATVSDGFDSVRTEWKMLWTAVELSGFTATLNELHGVRLVWETNFEQSNLGFDVWRSLSANGNFQRLNRSPITGNSVGHYEFTDEKVSAGKTYYYQLEDIDVNGKRTRHESISITIAAPQQFELAQNYPNPFNPETQIQYQLPVAASVELSIFNLLGQEIKTLVLEKQAPGFYTIRWDGTNQAGQPVASGIYLYRIKAEQFHQIRRMVLIR